MERAIPESARLCEHWHEMNQHARQLEQQRNDARDWVARLQKQTQTLTCVYCGQEYPPGSPTHGSAVLTEHIKVCAKHPMRAVEERCTKLRAALVGLVGADGRDELQQMDTIIRASPAPEADKAVSLDAIHVLIETLP